MSGKWCLCKTGEHVETATLGSPGRTWRCLDCGGRRVRPAPSWEALAFAWDEAAGEFAPAWEPYEPNEPAPTKGSSRR